MASIIDISGIDQLYPRAGQNNDSQGFRNNFVAIASGLTTAKSEITELQANTFRTDAENDFGGSLIVDSNMKIVTKVAYSGSIDDSTFNISFNKNNINSLGDLTDFGQPSQWASTAIGNDFLVNVGQPLGLMFGYQSDGRYEVSDFDYSGGTYTLTPGVPNSSSIIGTPVRPGSMKIKDTNGDGVINLEDRTIIGNANPKHTGGIVINGNYSNFDFSAGFNWSFGNDVYNANKIEHTTATVNNQYRNLLSIMEDGERWTNIDPSTGTLVTDPSQLAALNANTTMWSPFSNFVFTDWAVEDGSYLRLNR